ncbi:hypothetical protein JR316_0005650 [Psilocybe cubensis]|uniref:Uncharacterized protein n=2 Tax=Psilocybe cubensis TaxID=181762 RepID=A0ACB8H1R0_PSICU|nr:hypothetical protein JR316_0005650 [Psilocybe cubensis]KAH9481130.1 hypothetical protein JR316_0005650 [Psilocybe cubensis]
MEKLSSGDRLPPPSADLSVSEDEVWPDPPVTPWAPMHTQPLPESSESATENSEPWGSAQQPDVEDSGCSYVETFPGPTGTPVGRAPTDYQQHAEWQKQNQLESWYPFASQDEWELGRWLIRSGCSTERIDEFLRLNMVSLVADVVSPVRADSLQMRSRMRPAFKNTRALHKRVDLLPESSPWFFKPLKVTGNLKDHHNKYLEEDLELWYRNPVDCIAELLQNPALDGRLGFEPRRVYRYPNSMDREYNEMWSCDWWWERQKLLPEGATVCPVIISSDKTHLTNFSGDKQAWLVYISVGNIPKELRRSPSAKAMVLLGYLPVAKFACFDEARQAVEKYQLFHRCMRIIMEPLIKAGQEGVQLQCADGYVRLCFLILAAYIADYPEQCLVTCIRENSCPRCLVLPKQRGEYMDRPPLRTPDHTLEVLDDTAQGNKHPDFKKYNLRLVDPFWRDLPFCDIFEAIMPDLLHQLHKGIFKDHICNWAGQALEIATGPGEMDERFKAMSLHPDVRHFDAGITHTTQWTGKEHKAMEKVLLGILEGAVNDRVILCARALLDFIYYASFETHSDKSLRMLDKSWLCFHQNKNIFVELELRKHFNISKLHNIRHYVDAIRSFGTLDGFNTENTERLHIDLAKVAYRASNKQNYVPQMIGWLRRRENIHKNTIYLHWRTQWTEEHNEESDTEDEDDAGEDEEDDDVDQVEVGEVAGAKEVVHRVALRAPLPAVPLRTLVHEYGAEQLLSELNYYLEDVGSQYKASISSTFAVYPRARLTLPVIPEVGTEPVRDALSATPAVPARHTPQGTKRAVPPKFTTALFKTASTDVNKGPLDGLAVGQIRLIFDSPRTTSDTTKTPLLYVRWFKPLRLPQTEAGLCETSWSSRHGATRATVVPLTDVVRSCHLMPLFGRHIAKELGWQAIDVLHQAPKVALNPYLRLYDFYWFRYKLSMHEEEASPDRKATFGKKRKR